MFSKGHDTHNISEQYVLSFEGTPHGHSENVKSTQPGQHHVHQFEKVVTVSDPKNPLVTPLTSVISSCLIDWSISQSKTSWPPWGYNQRVREGRFLKEQHPITGRSKIWTSDNATAIHGWELRGLNWLCSLGSQSCASVCSGMQKRVDSAFLRVCYTDSWCSMGRTKDVL